MNTPTPRERFRKTLDISTGVSELLADSNASYIHWLEKELIAVTKERDRLAEAFQDMLNDTLTPTNDEWIVTDNENYIEIASIKTCDSIASVHGGKTIGDQYDLAGRIARVPQLERELIAAREEIEMMGIRYAAAEMHHANNMQEVTEQRDEARRLAEKYRNLSCDSQEEADETLLP
jgi:hypothetical protein